MSVRIGEVVSVKKEKRVYLIESLLPASAGR